jgi:hypothetical protein
MVVSPVDLDRLSIWRRAFAQPVKTWKRGAAAIGPQLCPAKVKLAGLAPQEFSRIHLETHGVCVGLAAEP